METSALGLSGFVILVLFLVWRSTDAPNAIIKIFLFFVGMFDMILYLKSVGIL